MASTNKTANYELSQYIGADIPNPLTDYNSDMEKIDTVLAGIATVAGEAKEGGDTANAIIGSGELETEAQTLIGAVNELKGEDDGLKSRVGTVETGLNSVNNSLATTNQALTNATNRVTSLETKVGNEELDTTAQSVTGAINELKAVDTSLDGRVSALEQGGGGGGGTVDTAMSSTSTNAVQNKVIKSYVDGQVNSLTGIITQIGGDVAKATGELRTGTIAATDAEATITFTSDIGANTLIDIYPDPFDVVPTAISTTLHSVIITIEPRARATNFAVVVKNID